MSMVDRDEATVRVIDELKRLYRNKIRPMEEKYQYDFFYSPLMTDAEFDSKPQVMLVGQYSVGKTSFIRYLLGRDFPGQRIGPEPTTDRFVVVLDGPDERTIPGNALAVSATLPYRGLERFGTSFLNRFEGSQLPSAVLRNITLVDTPGVLSGEKQRLARGYEFPEVCHWFAQRADLILLLFDAHKLDISDEFKAVIDKLRGNDDKIRCILNKSDQVDRQRLMRIYGALMWSMGKVLQTPEVMRVYIGSFWNEPLVYEDNAALFELEEMDLMKDLRELPRNSAVRKINELVKRVRLCKVHAYIISYLKEQMPSMFGKEKAQRDLINDLPNVFRTVMKRHNLAAGDFPDIDQFREKLEQLNFSDFPRMDPRMMEIVEQSLAVDLPRLMEALPRRMEEGQEFVNLRSLGGSEEKAKSRRGMFGRKQEEEEEEEYESLRPLNAESIPEVPLEFHRKNELNATQTSSSSSNPFGNESSDANSNPFDTRWVLSDDMVRNRAEFMQNSIEQAIDGLVRRVITGNKARDLLMATGVDTSVLRDLWNLSDMGRTGYLTEHEYTIAMKLVEISKGGEPLPQELPEDWTRNIS